MNETTKKTSSLSLHFGALADPISHQLREQGIDPPRKVIDSAQHSADAITALYIKGLLTHIEAEKIRRRLVKMLHRAVNS